MRRPLVRDDATAQVSRTVLIGRKAVATVKIGKGHPLKHRVLDVAAGAMQPKYPLNTMSTYLNGFHMHADDMGRQSGCGTATPTRSSPASWSPRASPIAEHSYSEDLVSTYGKTFHPWQYDRDDFPTESRS